MSSALPGRSSTQCFCCQSSRLTREWTVVSAFFARRALLGAPAPVELLRCLACGTRYFDFTPTQDQLVRLYINYRGEDYFRERHFFEPWYTREVNDDLGGELHTQVRRRVLAQMLAAARGGDEFENVLDHGGDRGQMLLELNAKNKFVYDISGVTPDVGVMRIDAKEIYDREWDLILSCHVLEHLPDPQAYLVELAGLGRPGTLYFFEVPDELFRSFVPSRWFIQKAWIAWLVRHPKLLKMFDFLSCSAKYRVNAIPPLLFWPLREHLSFFSVEGLVRFLEGNGFYIKGAAIGEAGHIVVVAIKK